MLLSQRLLFVHGEMQQNQVAINILEVPQNAGWGFSVIRILYEWS